MRQGGLRREPPSSRGRHRKGEASSQVAATGEGDARQGRVAHDPWSPASDDHRPGGTLSPLGEGSAALRPHTNPNIERVTAHTITTRSCITITPYPDPHADHPRASSLKRKLNARLHPRTDESSAPSRSSKPKRLGNFRRYRPVAERMCMPAACRTVLIRILGGAGESCRSGAQIIST